MIKVTIMTDGDMSDAQDVTQQKLLELLRDKAVYRVCLVSNGKRVKEFAKRCNALRTAKTEVARDFTWVIIRETTMTEWGLK